MKDVYRRAKGEACRMFEAAETQKARDWWAKRIEWLDKKLKAQPSNQPSKIERFKRFRTLLIIVNVAVLLSIFTCGCQTFKGVTGDTGWILTKMSDNIEIDKEK